METLATEMTSLNSALPGAFETAKTDYLAKIDADAPTLEGIYQSTVNEGYRLIYVTAAVSAAIAILLLTCYRKKKTVV